MSLLLFLSACGDPIRGTDGEDSKAPGADEPPALSLSATSIDFGEIGYNELESTLLSVSNSGDADLELTAITVESPFRVSQESLTVHGASTAQLTLSVQLSDYDDHLGTLSFTTNDPALPSVDLPLHAVLVRDADGDGYETLLADGGTDCDDNSAVVHPDAEESWYDGTDQDCDGASDYDQDGDGWEAETDDHHPTEPDCNDVSADYHPGAVDEWYDGRDANCDGLDDWDQDQDGEPVDPHGDDCDDLDATVGPDAVEVFDGVDNDCDERVDADTDFGSAPYRYQSKGRYDRAGSATALVDLDGDGDAEVLVGAPYVGAGGPAADGEGALAIYLGGDLLPTGTPIDDADVFTEGATSDEGLGAALAVLGDWDGDGLPDVAVQAGTWEDGAGAVHVMRGVDLLAGSDDGAALYTLTGVTREGVGRLLATGLDLDGDGLDELAASWEGDDQGLSLVYGGEAGGGAYDATGASWSTGGARMSEGGFVGADLDGDGHGDLAVADGGMSVGDVSGAGVVWVLFGAATHHDSATDATMDGEDWVRVLAGTTTDDGVGSALQTGEDWDDDGDDELWVYDAGEGLFVVGGGPELDDGVADPAEAPAAAWSWGSGSDDINRLARAGDWDGDGISDMAAWFDSSAGELALYASVGSGTRDGEDRLATVRGSTGDGNSRAGAGLAPLGADADGDGVGDLLTADPGYDGDAGEIYLFLQR